MVAGGLVVVAACVAIRHWWGADSADAQYPRREQARPAAASPPRSTPTTRSAAASGATKGKAQAKMVAMVNGEEINREDLGRECLWHYGNEVLEGLLNKHLIVQECARHNIAVTRKEVDAEINRMATRFGLSVDQWMTMLEKDRGISPARYADDIIWPTLALRKLAGEQLVVTPEEVQHERETQFGRAVQVRLIMCQKREKAEQVHAAAVADPASFGKLAKQHSEDVNSASSEGLIQPIRRHVGYKEIEQAAFGMQEGEISPVIKVGNQHVILLCERILPARPVDEARVNPQLEEAIRTEKMRGVAAKIFQKLQEGAKVVNVFNDPARSKQMPGVAALVNGQKIALRDLAEECIKRHGTDVLEGTINRKLIEQACKKRGITVAEQDLDAEIAQAAAMSVAHKKDGSPDVEAYLKLVVEEQKITVPIFRRDAVWPSVALKKLVSGSVEVTKEDIQRGFEANYGPRVRCRAIVMNDHRRANEVWEKARGNLTAEFFGQLAKQYSIDATSGSMGGQIPPIKKWGGQRELEDAAFKLRPGELSGILVLEGKYVMLLCEGYTEPVQVSMEEVHQELCNDIHEKKMRIAMGKYFRNLQNTAHIDNYLAGTVHSPKRDAAVKPAAHIPTLRQVPGGRR